MMRTRLVRVWLAPHGLGRYGADSTSLLVHGPQIAETAVVLHRSPAGIPPFVPRPIDEHVASGPDETDVSWLSIADVIVRRAWSAGTGRWHSNRVRTRFPGCLVVAIVCPGGDCAVESAGGWRARFIPARAGDRADDACSYASLLHAWLVAGRSLAEMDAAHVLVSGSDGARHGVRVSVRGRASPEGRRQAGA